MNDTTRDPSEPGTGRISRRAVIGGIVAAVALPAAVVSAWGQDTGSGVAQPGVNDPAASHPAESTEPVQRQDPSATRLQDGRILVAGGYYLGPLSSAQIYDPELKSWTDVQPMNTPRTQHAAVLLADGRVLVAGGYHLGPIADAEIFDPATGTWQPTAPMNLPRCQHSAAAVSDGAIVVGGVSRGVLSSIEKYNLATSDWESEA